MEIERKKLFKMYFKALLENIERLTYKQIAIDLGTTYDIQMHYLRKLGLYHPFRRMCKFGSQLGGFMVFIKMGDKQELFLIINTEINNANEELTNLCKKQITKCNKSNGRIYDENIFRKSNKDCKILGERIEVLETIRKTIEEVDDEWYCGDFADIQPEYDKKEFIKVFNFRKRTDERFK